MTHTDAQVEAALRAFFKDTSREYWPPGVMTFMRDALEAAEAVAWQPIETAPHGTRILIGGPDPILAGGYLVRLGDMYGREHYRAQGYTHWRHVSGSPR